MFIRQNKVDRHVYLQIVENRCKEGATRQRIVASLGRVDRLQAREQLDVEVRHRGKDYVLRPPLKGVAGKVFGAVGVAVPPPVRQPLPPGAKA